MQRAQYEDKLMKLITIEDVRDVYLKGIQRGGKFILSKISLSEKNRTKSSFNDTDISSSNWWDIPAVRKRWNYLITGNEDLHYEKYVSEKYVGEKSPKMLAIGSGVCSHELEFARLNPEWDITCLDFSEKLMQVAREAADEEGLKNIRFLVEDIYEYPLPAESFDIVFFHASLHHFKDMEEFLNRVHQTLISGGKLMINEYVGANRLQYDSAQIRAINQCLSLLDKRDKKMFKSNIYKNKYHGSGLLRMIISDPSECIESAKIIPVIHKKFRIIEENGFGGNLLMPVLKDIAHNFLKPDDRQGKALRKIFDFEDDYLKHHQSDFVFGVYEKVK